MKTDTPKETCETCYGLGRVDAVYAPCPDCELTAARELVKNLEITVLSLMMENKTVTEQRDRLAEALEYVVDDLDFEICERIGHSDKWCSLITAREALQSINPPTGDKI
jgi:hypothetical protein